MDLLEKMKESSKYDPKRQQIANETNYLTDGVEEIIELISEIPDHMIRHDPKIAVASFVIANVGLLGAGSIPAIHFLMNGISKGFLAKSISAGAMTEIPSSFILFKSSYLLMKGADLALNGSGHSGTNFDASQILSFCCFHILSAWTILAKTGIPFFGTEAAHALHGLNAANLAPRLSMLLVCSAKLAEGIIEPLCNTGNENPSLAKFEEFKKSHEGKEISQKIEKWLSEDIKMHANDSSEFSAGRIVLFFLHDVLVTMKKINPTSSIDVNGAMKKLFDESSNEKQLLENIKIEITTDSCKFFKISQETSPTSPAQAVGLTKSSTRPN